MKEEERKEIINKIQTEIKEKESLESMYKRLNKLTKNPFVSKYLQLLKEINRIEENIQSYRNVISGKIDDSLDKRIERLFNCYISSQSCDHKVWFYAGSYYRYTNYKYEEDYTMKDSEHLSDSLYTFSYNEYWCLECNQKIKISNSDWKKFEDTHIVLKKQPVNLGDIAYYYKPLYYHLLYHNYDFSDAEQIIIDEYNSNNEKNIKNVLSRRKK